MATIENLLLEKIKTGELNEKNIGEFTYEQLYEIYCYTQKNPNERNQFVEAKEYLEKINIQKLKNCKKIKIGFIANFSATWIGDELYNLFENSERFEPYVILLSNQNGQEDDMRMEEYYKNYSFFREKNMRLIQTIKMNGQHISWNELDIKPQIFIWLTPWIELFREDFFFLNYSLDTLHTYIPYGFNIPENAENTFVLSQYNSVIHNFVWKIFEESFFAVKMAQKYSLVGKSNAIYTGYPKMDAFYDYGKEDEKIWLDLLKKSGNYQAKRIIYAPHHTLEEWEPIHFSTFAKNYEMILDIAKKYENDFVWIFKPHPVLKYKAVKAGLFKDLNEWNDYISKWKQLKNADIMEQGDYSGLLLNSDGMICDSVSFLVEYLYTHKPLLFLQRDEQRFNELGKAIERVHYTANGDDRMAIEEFLENVIIADDDIGKNMREKFFEENFDYKKLFGRSAAENIFYSICEILD